MSKYILKEGILMKLIKTLSALTLSLSILSTTLINPIPTQAANQNPVTGTNYTMICRTSDSIYNQSDNLYHTTIIDEDENEWVIFIDQKLSPDTWLDVYCNDNSTPSILEDDSIYGFDIMPN
jgi:hypothetical protein